MYKVKLN